MSAYTQNRLSGSSLILSALFVVFLTAHPASAACINKFTHRDKGPQHTITLLTGKLTFQDAQALAVAIRDKKAQPLEWVDTKGKTIATQFGELKVIRPMPVSCDATPSGVIMSASFATVQTPTEKIRIKFDSKLTVEFEEQAE
ncbi:MAG TPA: hypothetical protein VLV78_19765 [Thermoanaerobaculia bacterium]|nr:hypothetical protein [Thermoanaerobaculia bacterium]